MLSGLRDLAPDNLLALNNLDRHGQLEVIHTREQGHKVKLTGGDVVTRASCLSRLLLHLPVMDSPKVSLEGRLGHVLLGAFQDGAGQIIDVLATFQISFILCSLVSLQMLLKVFAPVKSFITTWTLVFLHVRMGSLVS